jgi:Subtilase family
MPISVLVVVPGQEPIHESATAFAEGRPATRDLREATMPPLLSIDPEVPAIPVGTGRPEDLGAVSMAPGRSPAYVVRATANVERVEDVPEVVDGRPLFADPRIEPFVTCGGSPALSNATNVATLLRVAALTAGGRGLDGSNVAIAIMDTGINLGFLTSKRPGVRLDVANSWTPPNGSILPGKYPVDHGSMCAFDTLIAAPNATLLDFPILPSSVPGGSMVGRTIATAMLAFSQLFTNWAVSFAAGGVSNFAGLVVNNSWGIYHPSWDFPVGHRGRYIDNPRHPFNVLITAMTSSGIDLVFAAGNCGPACADIRCQGRTAGAIMGANAHSDVLTLGGCDINDQIVGYSSQGPSIANMFQQKPDVAAYTHFLGSEAFGAGSPDSGTSAACPVAAGCVAALRTKISFAATPPANLFAQIRATARAVPGQAGWQTDFGHGIIDPDATATSLGV